VDYLILPVRRRSPTLLGQAFANDPDNPSAEFARAVRRKPEQREGDQKARAGSVTTACAGPPRKASPFAAASGALCVGRDASARRPQYVVVYGRHIRRIVVIDILANRHNIW